jgi:hypothetical protein
MLGHMSHEQLAFLEGADRIPKRVVHLLRDVSCGTPASSAFCSFAMLTCDIDFFRHLKRSLLFCRLRR